MMASVIPSDLSSIKIVREFHLTDQDDQPFFSRDLTGKVLDRQFLLYDLPGDLSRADPVLGRFAKTAG